MDKRVINCFTFFNELELLELRLHELNPVIDRFVLVEATKTFKGAPKELLYEKHKQRYATFHDKIIHVIVDDMPDAEDPRLREHHQRRCIARGLRDLRPDDIIIVSDVDEILRPSSIMEMRNKDGYFMVDMPMFQFFMNTRAIERGWDKVFAFSYSMVSEIPDFSRRPGTSK